MGRSFTGSIMLNGNLSNVSNKRSGTTTSLDTSTLDRYQPGNLPKSALGSPVSAVIGRKRVANSNTMWTGNLRALTETTYSTGTRTEVVGGNTVTTTFDTTTVTVVGYLVDIHMAICLGPDVHLTAIYVDNEQIWTGDKGPARSSFSLGVNNTFLSEADCVFSGGAFNQAPEPLVVQADYPGYVGIATILLQGVRADLPMGNVSFEVVRVPNPLGLSTGVNRSGDDVNTVSAVVEVMTNEWGYGGITLTDVDTATLTAMAATAATELNFCSIKLDAASDTSVVLKSLSQQLDAIFYQNPQTGKITGKLVRASGIDYVTASLRYSTANIIELRAFSKGGWRDTVHQIQAFYTERDADYNELPISIQNAANINQSGRSKITAIMRYPYSPSGDLTAALASRDLAKVASPHYSFSIVTNRDGADRTPGDIIVVDWPDDNLINVPMLVEKVRKQPIENNMVVLDLSRIKFPVTKAYTPTALSYNPGFTVGPVVPSVANFIVAPKFVAAYGGSPLVGTDGIVSNGLYAGFGYRAISLPTPANGVQTRFIAYQVLAANYKMNIGYYPTVASLNGAISKYTGFATGIIPSLTIDGVINSANLANIGLAGVRSGNILMFVDNEIMSFESFTDNLDGTYTLTNVHRALLDTTLVDHADNARVLIINNGAYYNQSPDLAKYIPDPASPSIGISSDTISEAGTDVAIFPTAITPYNRIARPLRPHNTKVNAVARSSTPVPITVGASVTVTWATRSRYNVVALMLDAAEAAQMSGGNSQKHRVFHQVTGGGAITEIGGAAFTGNSATFTMPSVTLGAGSIYVQANILYSGAGADTLQLDSFDHIPVTVS